jgi:signal transduction histidine kinase/ligand-binding sensor domain-containing protein/ActR/RegA family two-component response regulator
MLQLALATSAPAASAPPLAEPSFRNYGIAEGLPSSVIDAMAMDRDDYLWISTESGLVRYGGSGFRVWRHDPHDPNSISGATLATLFVDRNGTLWGGSQEGLVSYDPAHENFRHWLHDPADPTSPVSDDVTALAQSPGGPLWVGHFDDGLDRMRKDGRGFDHVRHDPANPASLASNVVYSLLADPDGSVWAGIHGGVDHILPDGRIVHVPFDRPDDALRDKPLLTYHLARSGDALLIATNYGLYALGANGVATLLAPGELSNQAVYSTVVDRAGRLWVGTSDGLYLRHADGHFQHVAARPLLRYGLPDANAYGLVLDREGGLWIATGNGLSYLPPDWADLRFFTHTPETPDSLVLGPYTAVATNGNDHLWIGGKGGALDRLDLATGNAEHLPWRMPQERDVYSMAEDARGRLWFSSPSGSYVLDHGQVTELKTKRPEHIEFGDDGTAFLQRPEGVLVIDPDSLAVRPLQLDPKATHIPVNDTRWYAHALWIATDAGLLRWAPGDARAQFVAGMHPGGVGQIDLRDQQLWELDGTSLNHYRLDGAQARWLGAYPMSLQHPVSDVLSIRADRADRVWFFSRSGLWRFDSRSGKLREFGLDQGLPDGQFTNTGLAETPDGHVYAAAKDGVVGFAPDDIHEPTRVPGVRLESITVRRGDQTQRLDGTNNHWNIAWNDRDITVTVRALSYIAPERNSYRFRLAGMDTGWVGTGHRPDRGFSQLPGGNYKLYVQAAGPDGAWGDLGRPLRLHVDTAPWLRWWSWLMYTLLLAAIFSVVLLASRRRQRQRMQLELVIQQHRLAQSASEAKTQFLAELGHEIRTPMTGVLGMAELLLNRPLGSTERDYVQTIQRSGEVLLTLVNDALDLARIEAGRLQLTPAPFDPRALLRDVAQLQRGRAAGKGLALHMQIADDAPAQVLGDAVRIKQILLNLGGNALKFTDHGEVRLSLDTVADGLRFTVSDTGPGISAADQARLFQRFEQLDGPQRGSGSGLGLAICRELTALMGGRIELESTPGKGSTFRVELPLPAVEDMADAPNEATRADSPSLHLLLLEDDATVAAVISGLLQAQGHQVDHEPNGLRAMQALENQRYDAALVDLDLPGVDGFQWARMVRLREQGGHLPMIAITARSGGNEEVLAREAGMDGFLRKPLHGEQLAKALAVAMRAFRPG